MREVPTFLHVVSLLLGESYKRCIGSEWPQVRTLPLFVDCLEHRDTPNGGCTHGERERKEQEREQKDSHRGLALARSSLLCGWLLHRRLLSLWIDVGRKMNKHRATLEDLLHFVFCLQDQPFDVELLVTYGQCEAISVLRLT